MKTKFFYLLNTLFSTKRLSTGVKVNLIKTTDQIKQIEVKSPIYIEPLKPDDTFRPFLKEIKYSLN